MSSIEALFLVLGLFAVFTIVAVLLLKLRDRSQPRKPGSGKLVAEPGQVRFLIAAVVLVVFLFAYAWLRDNFSDKQLLIVLAPIAVGFVLWVSSRRRQVDATLEAVADEIGWYRGPAGKKKAFSVLPEGSVVREWQGSRAGLTILDPSPKQPGSYGRLRMSLAVPCEGTLTIRARSRGTATFSVVGDRRDLEASLQREHASRVVRLLSDPRDALVLRRAVSSWSWRSWLELSSNRRDPCGFRPTIRFART